MDSESPGRVLRFDRFRLDLLRGALLDDSGAEVALRPKSFALLRHLAENAGRLVDRDEIMRAVWPNVIVTDDSIAQCVKEVRRALGDDDMRLLRTLPRRGFLFAATVTRDAPTPAPQAEPPDASIGGPVLAVLPFANLTGDPEQEYFADGITEDLTIALSHMRWFSVIARNSAFTYKDRPVDPRQAGRELGVGYLLGGSVRRAGARVRITAHLSEAATGRQVWAERFDGDLSDIFALQDRVTEAVAGAIEPSLRLAEVERAHSKPTESLTAYDLYLRGLTRRYAWRAGSDEAVGLLRRAIALDPGFMAAKGLLAVLHTARHAEGWSEEGDLAEAAANAAAVARSVAADPTALAFAGHTLAFLALDYEAGLGAAERAVSLAPNSAMVLFLSGRVRTYVSDAEVAIPRLERALRLSPMDPAIFYTLSGLSLACFVAGRYEEGVDWARKALRDRAAFPSARRLLITNLARLGRLEEAREALQELLAMVPGYTLAQAALQIPLRDPAMRELFLMGLREAGLPE